ncbi:MAG: hypothetical protein F4X99_16695 [Gammaproteobacteria bacterium]|nr:hypothetical protein [Gammaproteobacteria bacterium]
MQLRTHRVGSHSLQRTGNIPPQRREKLAALPGQQGRRGREPLALQPRQPLNGVLRRADRRRLQGGDQGFRVRNGAVLPDLPHEPFKLSAGGCGIACKQGVSQGLDRQGAGAVHEKVELAPSRRRSPGRTEQGVQVRVVDAPMRLAT